MLHRFSVVVACYNHERFVRDAVDSALSQSCLSMEVIAVDDKSTDRTADILDTYGQSIILHKMPENRGVGAARNAGASLATGEYLVFLDGDDVLMPWALKVYERLILAHAPEIILGQVEKFTGRKPVSTTITPCDCVEFITYPDFLSKDRSWIYNTSALVVHRSAFVAVGGWSPDIYYQDIQDLLSKLGNAGKTLLVLSPQTVWYRMHTTNAVRNVAGFVRGIEVLMEKESSGKYPLENGAAKRRRVWFGGLIFYWIIQALRAGLYGDAYRALARHGWLVPLAIAKRAAAIIVGRRQSESLHFRLELDEVPPGHRKAFDAVGERERVERCER